MIRFDFEINILALISLLLSSTALALQLLDSAIGPQVTLHPPKTVAVRFFTPRPDSDLVVHFEIPISITNLGAKDYGAIMLPEGAVLTDGTGAEALSWRLVSYKHFSSVDHSESNLERGPSYISPRPPSAVVVPGGGAAGHYVRLVPVPVECEAGTSCNTAANSIYVSKSELGIVDFFAGKKLSLRIFTSELESTREHVVRCEFAGDAVASQADKILSEGVAYVDCQQKHPFKFSN